MLFLFYIKVLLYCCAMLLNLVLELFLRLKGSKAVGISLCQELNTFCRGKFLEALQNLRSILLKLLQSST